MAKLKGLQLAEFSIVHGDDHRPANPEATALVFKAAQKEGEGEMQKATTIPAAEPPRTLAQKIGDAVRNVMGETQKAVQTRTSTSESRSSSSLMTDARLPWFRTRTDPYRSR